MSETRCPACGELKERIAQHWAMSACEYPEIDDRRRALVDGLVLAGATVAGNGSNRHLRIGTTSPDLATWVADQLGWLCHGVREVEGRGERDVVHQVRTPAHPGLNRYERWDHAGESSGRIPPTRFSLTPLSGRVWWAFAGGLEWSTPFDGSRVGVFSTDADKKRDWVGRILEDASFDASVLDGRVKLPPTVLDAWLEWIGSAVPGAEHKWAEHLVVYRALRADAQSDAEYRTALHTAALEVARERTDGELTPGRFDARVDVVDSEDVAEWLGGGEWGGALSVAGVDPAAHPSPDPTVPERGDWQPSHAIERDERDEALRAAAEAMGEPLTKAAYREWRDGQPDAPSTTAITERWGWSASLIELGIEPSKQLGHSIDDLLAAVRRVKRETGEWPDTETYTDHRKAHEPSVPWFYANEQGFDSWDELVDQARQLK